MKKFANLNEISLSRDLITFQGKQKLRWTCALRKKMGSNANEIIGSLILIIISWILVKKAIFMIFFENILMKKV